ncbi:methyltransferase [Streptomyces sp. NPDC014733]|uniref:methyltransferase n=1 Tax=Streptomyces sp. NPDC014733 TaxID=3364885 RepID=UPI0036FD39CB
MTGRPDTAGRTRPGNGGTRLLHLSDGLLAARALHLVAAAGVADALAAGPRPVAELAAATRTHPDALHRLLRVLAGEDVFREVRPGVFALSPTGQYLRSDHPESVHALLAFCELVGRSFADAMHSLRTGEATFPRTYGRPFFDHLRAHPEADGLFNAGMAQVSRRDAAALVDAYDFGGARTVVDIGGGDGGLLLPVLGAFPGTDGVLFDQPHVVAAARERIAAAGLADRCRTVAGDLFGALPPGGDLYLLKWILHDWPDEEAVAILRGCRQAMGPDGRLLVIERLIPAGNHPHPAKMLDLVVLVLLGGRERTAQEYEALLDEAGLTACRVIGTASGLSILEARRA